MAKTNLNNSKQELTFFASLLTWFPPFFLFSVRWDNFTVSDSWYKRFGANLTSILWLPGLYYKWHCFFTTQSIHSRPVDSSSGLLVSLANLACRIRTPINNFFAELLAPLVGLAFMVVAYVTWPFWHWLQDIGNRSATAPLGDRDAAAAARGGLHANHNVSRMVINAVDIFKSSIQSEMKIKVVLPVEGPSESLLPAAWVKRTMQRIEGHLMFSANNEDVLVLIPLVSESHWMMLVYDRSHNALVFLDSSHSGRSDGRAKESIITPLRQAINEYEQKRTGATVKINYYCYRAGEKGHQIGGTRCGDWCALFAYAFLAKRLALGKSLYTDNKLSESLLPIGLVYLEKMYKEKYAVNKKFSSPNRNFIKMCKFQNELLQLHIKVLKGWDWRASDYLKDIVALFRKVMAASKSGVRDKVAAVEEQFRCNIANITPCATFQS